MEEKILIKSQISPKVKKAFMILALSFIVLAIIFVFVGLSVAKREWISSRVDNTWEYSSSKGGYYKCSYHKVIEFSKEEMITHYHENHKVPYGDSAFEYGLPYYIINWSFLYLGLIFLLMYWMVSKIQITVTDKRVYGKTYFGRSVDLPLDSISAIGAGMFNTIAVATSSGKIKFSFVENAIVVHKRIRELIVDRQEKKKNDTVKVVETKSSNADELRKYKQLLDDGIISKEEFEAKKKSLLGL